MWNNTPRPLTWGKGGRLYWKIYLPGISWAIGSWYGWLKQKVCGNLLGCSERDRSHLGAVIWTVDFWLFLAPSHSNGKHALRNRRKKSTMHITAPSRGLPLSEQPKRFPRPFCLSQPYHDPMAQEMPGG